ncbi:MAG: MATE family efflux transporter [Oscillospiraceae bacterium]|nr:MATE family efflux transporter [Oscillospiraceae bacterium]
MDKTINDFTTGSIPKAMLRFSLPFFLTSLIQSLYNIADIMVISRFCGTAGVAGAAIGGNILNTATYTIIGLCNGGAIMTAQYAGMKSDKDIKETINTTFGLMLILSVVFTAAALILSDKILTLLNTPAEAFEQTKSYFSVCMFGAVFIFGYNTVCAVLRGLGDSKTPMYFGIGACVLNIFLDLLLVGGFNMNASGAALATIISQASALLGCIIYLKKRSFIFDFKLSGFRIIPKKAVDILKLGLPGAIQSAIVSGGFLIVSSITNSLGVNAASGVAVAAKINNFAQMPANSIGMAVSSMVGQNVGAEKFDRARGTLKTGIAVSLCIGALLFLFVESFPLQLMGLLVDDAEVLSEALPYLRVTAFDYLLVALIFPLNGLCNGSGHTLFTMIPSIFSSVIARIPVAVFCVRTLNLGLLGVGISTPTGTISAIIICAVYYFSNRWCKRVV